MAKSKKKAPAKKKAPKKATKPTGRNSVARPNPILVPRQSA